MSDEPNSIDPQGPRASANPIPAMDFRELGVTGLKRFSGFVYDEFLPELVGWKGVAVYTEMARNDPTIAAVLFAIKMLCRRVKWFVEPQSSLAKDVEAAEFLESCMNDMSQTWLDTIHEILSMLEYGHCAEEIVYKRRCGEVDDPRMRSQYADGRIGWRKLSIRSQDTLYRWEFDPHGGIQGVEQIAPPTYINTTIPIQKILLFRTSTERNNPEGRSLLRGAYTAWYKKKNIENIEAIGVERDLAGLPMAIVPPELLSPNATAESKNLLAAIRDIVLNVRRNAEDGIIFPAVYDPVNGKSLYDFKLLSTGGTRQFDTSAIINRYDSQIARTMLADFLLLGQEKVGSFALVNSRTNLFATAVGAVLDAVADVFNRYGTPRLFALNPDLKPSKLPLVKHGDLGAVDLKELGDYIQKLTMAGAPVFPNPDLERHLLEVAGLPAPPEEDPTSMPMEDGSAGAGNAGNPGTPPPRAKPALAAVPRAGANAADLPITTKLPGPSSTEK